MLTVPMTPELKRIMQTKYLDELEFWDVVPQAGRGGRDILNFSQYRAIMWIVNPLATLFFIVVMSFLGLFYVKVCRNMQGPFHWLPIVMMFFATFVVAMPVYVARTWQVWRAWRSGPWITLNEYAKTITLPQQNVEITTAKILWSTRHSDFSHKGGGVTELQLLLFPDSPEQICISISSDYGNRGLRNIDRKAELLAELTRAQWRRSGYPTETSK